MTIEPLTVENRIALSEIEDTEAWGYYKRLESLVWNAQEVNMSADYADWREKLSAGQRAFYTAVLGLFGPGDELVSANLNDNFLAEMCRLEVRFFYSACAAQENVHTEAYSLQIRTILDPADATKLLTDPAAVPAVASIVKWVRGWSDPKLPLGHRLMAFGFFEGLIFQGQFMAIQMLKTLNVMPGLTEYNEFIARDENLHCEFACFLVRERLTDRPSQEEMKNLLGQAVALCDEFFAGALAAARAAEGLGPDSPSPVPKLNEEGLHDYVRNVADRVAAKMGYKKVYRTRNPFPESMALALDRKSVV